MKKVQLRRKIILNKDHFEQYFLLLQFLSTLESFDSNH